MCVCVCVCVCVVCVCVCVCVCMCELLAADAVNHFSTLRAAWVRWREIEICLSAAKGVDAMKLLHINF